MSCGLLQKKVPLLRKMSAFWAKLAAAIAAVFLLVSGFPARYASHPHAAGCDTSPWWVGGTRKIVAGRKGNSGCDIYPLQHWTQRRGVFLEALYKMSEGFFFGPHHLILAALLYFEEKVHRKKLQRADCIPLLFPRLLCQILEHLGYPSEHQLERKRICREPFTLDKWNNMTAYKVDQPEQPQPAARRASPRHIPEGITVAAPAIPRAPPATPASSQPSTSAESRMAIPISEYRELCRALETLTASQSSLAQEMAAIRVCQEQMLATQAQQAAILRQLQIHFDLPQVVEPSTSTPEEPHSHPSESHPPEPQAPADVPTEEADPSA